MYMYMQLPTVHVGLKLGHVDLTAILFQIHWVLFVYLCIQVHVTALLTISCSSVSRRLTKAWEELPLPYEEHCNEFKNKFSVNSTWDYFIVHHRYSTSILTCTCTSTSACIKLTFQNHTTGKRLFIRHLKIAVCLYGKPGTGCDVTRWDVNVTRMEEAN